MPAPKWIAHDRLGNPIYLTQERWNHILARHAELTDHLEDLLETLRKVRRRQQPADPSRYTYHLRCDSLPEGFNHIIVAVVCRRIEQPDGTEIRNNFVTSAWGVFIQREA